MPDPKSIETKVDEDRRPSDVKLAAVVEAAYILEAVRR
jgi:hypothetical protein